MKVDWTRILRGTGLVAWAVFFDYLWISGRSVDYVGPRTTWVVAFGAIALTGASILYVSGLLTRDETTRPTARELGRLVIILSPIALAAAAPSVTLGAQAVDQKRTADGATSLARLEAYDGTVRLYELAAAMQTVVPQSVFTGVLTTPLLGAGLLMTLAFILSLCSEADAFVAVSFIQFPLGPQLAFLVFGPILDIKLALLYGATFGRAFVVRLLLVTVPLVLVGAMLFQEVVV